MKCNLCEYEGEFLPMGSRENARCPNCKSLERHRDLVKHLKLNGNVLHISPNGGLANYLDAKNLIIYKKSYIEQGGYDVLKKINDKFNHVIAIHVLDLVDISKALKNIYNCLNDDGVLWLQVPFSEKLTEKGLKMKLSKTGFKYRVLDKNHKYFKCSKNAKI